MTTLKIQPFSFFVDDLLDPKRYLLSFAERSMEQAAVNQPNVSLASQAGTKPTIFNSWLIYPILPAV